MRLVLTGGGTGGHIYPALSVAAALRRAAPETELLYLGTPGGVEQRLVPEHGIAFRPVHSGQVRGKTPKQVVVSAMRLARGVGEARAALTSFGANAVFATGGYASVPVVLAGALTRTPVTVFLPDVYPGWAVKTATRFAARVATTTEGALDFLPRSKTVVTGYPLRPEFWHATRTGGRERLGTGSGPVLLISGASTGSRALNSATLAVLEPLLSLCEVVHLTGAADEGRMRAAHERLPAQLRPRYHVHGYLEDIAWAMAAADLAVLRAGASCLAEPAALGLPCVLVPGPFSDQHRNASYVASVGAAVVLEETRLAELPDVVRELLTSPGRLEAMSVAARAIARPRAADTLASLLLESGRHEQVHQACRS
jgi:UDP-N-acetylglucosamine--N-acetylmuramyl-(pentapeptide) pyrophosphoryl-undecaprenol N-acetylglucosamine transferase